MYTHKKSLGQHFLKDENVINKIIEVLKENDFTNLLEVGPGAGALTKHLMVLPYVEFKAVELDEEKVVYLSKKYPSLADKIIHQSFLDMDKPYDGPFTVIGNFPYNISTEIVFKVIQHRDRFPELVGMFQKNFAKFEAQVDADVRAAAPDLKLAAE